MPTELPEDLLYQRLSRNWKAYSNMVIEMNFIKSLLDKGKGKASGSHQGLTQCSGVTTSGSERGRGGTIAKNPEECRELSRSL